MLYFQYLSLIVSQLVNPEHQFGEDNWNDFSHSFKILEVK